MIRIFIESKKPETSEYNFLSTYIHTKLGIPPHSYSIVCVNGKDNLHNIKNKLIENTLEGGKNLIIFDADTPSNNGGFTKRQTELLSQIKELNCDAELFLFPNNQDDGMFENLLENLTLPERYKNFFDCYSDYEACLGDDYRHPDLKGKVFTYISSMKSLSNTKWKKLGNGEWQFDNPNYWNLDAAYLQPLKDFLYNHFKESK